MSLTHLAIIMDGNRRWAQKNGYQALYEDRSQAAVDMAISWCLKRGVPYLSLYTFSLENMAQRDSALTARVCELIVKNCRTKQEALIAQGVRVRFVGDRGAFPAQVIAPIAELEAATAAQTQLHLSIIFCYGAQQELAYACRQLASQVQAGTLEPAAITPEHIAQQLWTFPVPPPDLIVRTGGQQRLSNFLLFQAAYSELQFLDRLWPELSADDLERCLSAFTHTQRNFGT